MIQVMFIREKTVYKLYELKVKTTDNKSTLDIR